MCPEFQWSQLFCKVCLLMNDLLKLKRSVTSTAFCLLLFFFSGVSCLVNLFI